MAGDGFVHLFVAVVVVDVVVVVGEAVAVAAVAGHVGVVVIVGG